jgi:hypothetical protein
MVSIDDGRLSIYMGAFNKKENTKGGTIRSSGI